MLIDKDVDKIEVTQKMFAEALGISRPWVVKLAQEGTVVGTGRKSGRRESLVYLVPSMRNFYARKGARGKAGNGSEGMDADYMQEKALRERAECGITELKLAKIEGHVFDATTVELALTERASNVRARLLAMPSKLAPVLEGMGEEAAREALAGEVEEALAELWAYEPKRFTDEEFTPANLDEAAE